MLNEFSYIFIFYIIGFCLVCSIMCCRNGMKQKHYNIELNEREKELNKLESYLDKKYERLYLWESQLNEYHDNLLNGKKQLQYLLVFGMVVGVMQQGIAQQKWSVRNE